MCCTLALFLSPSVSLSFSLSLSLSHYFDCSQTKGWNIKKKQTQTARLKFNSSQNWGIKKRRLFVSCGVFMWCTFYMNAYTQDESNHWEKKKVKRVFSPATHSYFCVSRRFNTHVIGWMEKKNIGKLRNFCCCSRCIQFKKCSALDILGQSTEYMIFRAYYEILTKLEYKKTISEIIPLNIFVVASSLCSFSAWKRRIKAERKEVQIAKKKKQAIRKIEYKIYIWYKNGQAEKYM